MNFDITTADALKAGRFDDALDLALAWWRATRAEPLCELIDAITERLGPHPTLIAKTKRATMLAFADAVRAKQVAGLGEVLVASFAEGQARDIKPCLDELRSVPADPRIEVALLRGFEAVTHWPERLYAGRACESKWAHLDKLLQTHARIGTGERLKTMALQVRSASVRAPSDDMTRAMVALVDRLARTAKALENKRFEPAPCDMRDLLALCAEAPAKKAGKPRGEATEAELLAAIIAAPEDDTRRAVYADFLQQRGDVRGEFIALQLSNTPAATKRANALYEKHSAALLGALAAHVNRDQVAFERGFLAVVQLKATKQYDVERAVSSPDWALVRAVTFARGSAFSASMQRVTEARGVTAAGLKSLRRLPGPLALRHLGVMLTDQDEVLDQVDKLVAALPAPKLAPQLTSLGLENLGWHWGWPPPGEVVRRLPAHLKRLVVSDEVPIEPSAWLEVAAPRLAQFGLGFSWGTFEWNFAEQRTDITVLSKGFLAERKVQELAKVRPSFKPRVWCGPRVEPGLWLGAPAQPIAEQAFVPPR